MGGFDECDRNLEIRGCFSIRTIFREEGISSFITRYSISLAIKRLLIYVCMHPAVSRFSHKHLICNNEDGRSVSNRGNSGVQGGKCINAIWEFSKYLSSKSIIKNYLEKS